MSQNTPDADFKEVPPPIIIIDSYVIILKE